jgi:uncharacterized protein YqjF (DUF2071 family)
MVRFLSLDAANPVAVVLARAWFHVPYHHARMTLTHTDPGTIHYASRRLRSGPRPATTDIRCRPTGTPGPAIVGTLDHFLLERYLLYCTARGRLYRGQVHHRPYPAQNAEVVAIEESLLSALGLERPAGPPLAHYSEGVDVEIFSLERASVS